MYTHNVYVNKSTINVEVITLISEWIHGMTSELWMKKYCDYVRDMSYSSEWIFTWIQPHKLE